MGFVDYGGFAAFLHIKDAFSRFAAITFTGTKKKEDQTEDMVRGKSDFELGIGVWGARNYHGG